MGDASVKLSTVATDMIATVSVMLSEKIPLIFGRSPEPMYRAHSTWEPTIRTTPVPTQIVWNGA